MNQKNNNQYCTECGAKIEGGNYCQECGKKIDNNKYNKKFLYILLIGAGIIIIGFMTNCIDIGGYPDHTTEVNIDGHNFLIPAGYKETKDIKSTKPVKNQLSHVKWYENNKGNKIVITVRKNEQGYKTTMPDAINSNSTHTLKQYMENDDCIYIHAPKENIDINSIAIKK